MTTENHKPLVSVITAGWNGKNSISNTFCNETQNYELADEDLRILLNTVQLINMPTEKTEKYKEIVFQYIFRIAWLIQILRSLRDCKHGK